MTERQAPWPDGEVLAGIVERVTFHNVENGFCVLRVKARGTVISLQSSGMPRRSALASG